MMSPALSICIATRNRAVPLAETLNNIIREIDGNPHVEIVIVDGESTDATPQVVSDLAAVNSSIKYFPQTTNSGVDGDFDKAVRLATGVYCWLFSDDDFLMPGSVASVLKATESSPDVVVVDAEVRTADMAELLSPHRLSFRENRKYNANTTGDFLRDCAAHLTFIGAVVVRRDVWMARDRKSFMGTEFIHVGVLFQEPALKSVIALTQPHVSIRYGVGNWAARSFDVWMYKWPRLIWSFSHIDRSSRAHVTKRDPWKSPARLAIARAKGWYSWKEFKQYVWPRSPNKLWMIAPAFIAMIPGTWLCSAAIAILKNFRPKALGGIYDLARSRFAKAGSK